jgi:hypothetical protein
MDEAFEALGRRVARRLMVRGERPQVRTAAEQLGVEIVEQAAPPPAQPGLRSEYRKDPPRIILYRDPIRLLAGAIHANQRFDMLNCNLVEVHIAHELFHHLEAADRFGKLRPEESEEAAHAFAQELLGLTFNPSELHELLA